MAAISESVGSEVDPTSCTRILERYFLFTRQPEIRLPQDHLNLRGHVRARGAGGLKRRCDCYRPDTLEGAQ